MLARRKIEFRARGLTTLKSGVGRFPSDAVQDECSFWTFGESTVHDPIASFMNLGAKVRHLVVQRISADRESLLLSVHELGGLPFL